MTRLQSAVSRNSKSTSGFTCGGRTPSERQEVSGHDLSRVSMSLRPTQVDENAFVHPPRRGGERKAQGGSPGYASQQSFIAP